MIGPLVEFMLAQPGMVARLLDVHVPDGSGRCRGCRQHDRVTPAHPCPIRLHAQAARDVACGRHGTAVITPQEGADAPVRRP